MPRVTVIMACHNNADTVEAACNSILRQTFDDLELVVVNDASTDKFHEAISRIKFDKRLKLIETSENVGSGRARNIAIRETASDLIAVMDADDISMATRIERQVRGFDDRQKAVAIATQLAEFGTWGGPVASRWPTNSAQINNISESLGMPLPHPSSMFRRSIVEEVGGYDESCVRAQDYALFLKLRGMEMHCIPSIEVLYRTDRPISLTYAIKNGRYADLARRRNLYADDLGAKFPNEPRSSLIVDSRAVAGWGIRRLKEMIHT